MSQFKVGDTVARKSYNYDVLFKITNIRGEMVDLVGMTVRILADAPIYDLKYITKDEEIRMLNINDKRFDERLSRTYSGIKNRFNLRSAMSNANYINDQIPIYAKDAVYKKPGVVLHIDGDTHLSNQKKYSNTNTSEQVIFNHNKNNVSKIKIHYFFITKREEFCEREHI